MEHVTAKSCGAVSLKCMQDTGALCVWRGDGGGGGGGEGRGVVVSEGVHALAESSESRSNTFILP